MLTISVYFILPTLLLILGLPIFLVLLVTCLVAYPLDQARAYVEKRATCRR